MSTMREALEQALADAAEDRDIRAYERWQGWREE